MDIKTKIKNLPNYKKYLQVVGSIEEYLNSHNFQKLDLPVLLPSLIPESYLEVFETEYIFFDQKEKMYLTPSPELLIKRLITEGIGDCYYLGKSYRNSEPASRRHLGEFTMLEMYKINASYMEMAELVLEMMRSILQRIQSNPKLEIRNSKINYRGLEVDLEKWEKISVAEAFEKYAGITPVELFDHEKFINKARIKGYKVDRNIQHSINSYTPTPYTLHPTTYSYEELWSQIYSNEIESHLGTNGFPTLIYNYPVEFASLSKPNSDGKTAQRFEFYVAGLELGNCYGELTDYKLQEKRLQIEQQERIKSGKIQHKPDLGFLDALKKGMPECSGIAIGVERLAMIFANLNSIDELKLISLE
ncbi:MAG: amino acid--tRNA ligase-related protein [Patescibacteria group bacterium]